MAKGKKEHHPPGLYVLFGTEAAERFSFYTMRAILVLYMTSIILPVLFDQSEEYQNELRSDLGESPAETFRDIARDVSQEQNDQLKAVLTKRDSSNEDLEDDELVAAQAALFSKAMATHRGDLDEIIDEGFTRIRDDSDEADSRFEQAVASLEDDARGFVEWVVGLKIKRDIRDRALSVYGLYLLLVYLSGLIGGYFSDKILGSRKAILMGGMVMGVGLFVMWYPQLVFYGLGLIIAGNGFFKPNISTIVSGLYPEGDKRRDPAFTIFYMGINLGAFFAIFGAGYAESLSHEHDWGWNVGFVVAGVGMLLSLLLFLVGQKYLGTAGFPPERDVNEDSRLTGKDYIDVGIWFVGVIAVVVAFLFVWGYVGAYWASLHWAVKLAIAAVVIAGAGFGVRGRKSKHKDDKSQEPLTVEEWQRVAVIAILSIFVIFFWAGFEQAGGTMNLFAFEQTDRHIGSWEMPATYFQGFNPLFIIALAPLFSMIWNWQDKKSWGLTTPSKMGLGMIVLGLGFVLMYFGQQAADEHGKAALWWLVGVYLLHTIGELCLSPIGLSMVTKLSPVRIVSLMMGVWFACTAVADYMSGQLEWITHEFGINLWLVLIASSLGAGLVLWMLTPLLRKWMHGRG